MIKIEYLADFPEYRPIVNEWHDTLCKTLLSELSETQWKALISLNRSKLPLTLIAMELFDVGAPELAGMVILRHHRQSPYLEASVECCSLFVPENRRGKGIGGLLLRKLCSVAMNMGYQSVYTCTPNMQKWFEKKGWAEISTDLSSIDNCPFTVMSKEIGITSSYLEKPSA